MEKDWDNLIILDACRLDMYRDLRPNTGNIRSLGSSTEEFILRNFKGKYFSDTVYITANPFVDLLVSDNFHKIYPVWETHWNQNMGTVLPSEVKDEGQKALEKHPNKRIIVHFMQPHYPFITNNEIGGSISGLRHRARGNPEGQSPDDPWTRLRNGEIPRDVFWKAYTDNLKNVLPVAKNFAEDLDGKSVITSDHGNAFGEWVFPFPFRYYGHIRGLHIPALVKVPWDEFSGKRRKISKASERHATRERVDQTEINDKLRDLGYV